MKKKRVLFGKPAEVINLDDDSRSFRFPFSCVHTANVDSPEEGADTTHHDLIVTVARRLFVPWRYSDDELRKVLFRIGCQKVLTAVEEGTLQPVTRVELHWMNFPKDRPYDATMITRIKGPEGEVFCVQEERRIGF